MTTIATDGKSMAGDGLTLRDGFAASDGTALPQAPPRRKGHQRWEDLDPAIEALAISLYDARLSDGAIGRRVGMRTEAIMRWRHRTGRPAHGSSNWSSSSHIDYAEAQRLYDEGLTDYRIGQLLGCHPKSVANWRDRNGLPNNFMLTYTKELAEKAAGIERFYGQGLVDRQISSQLGIAPSTVFLWRKRRDLPSHSLKTYGACPKTDTMPALRDPLFARVNDAVDRFVAADIREETISEMVLAVLEGRLAEDNIEAEAQKYQGRSIGLFASKFGPLSLDERRPGDEGSYSFIDKIADPSQMDNLRLVELILCAERMGLDAAAILADDDDDDDREQWSEAA